MYRMHLLKDIRFWIFLLFVMRLYNIDAPILDSHAWRQADGYAIARNLYEGNTTLMFPMIDHAGHLSGITGSEFPIMNVLIASCYNLFGVQWWPGRLLNLLISSIACLYFYKLIHNIFNQEIAFNGTLILLTSIWFAHSRKFMPDVFSTSLVIIGIYFGFQYLTKDQRFVNIVLCCTLCCLGLLSKLSSFVTLALLSPVIVDRTINIKLKLNLIGLGSLFVLPVLWWYFFWSPSITEEFGYPYFFMGNSMTSGLKSLYTNIPKLTIRFAQEAIQYVGFGCFLIGIALVIIKRDKYWLPLLSFSMIFLSIYMIKSGATFVKHTYYIIPFVPIMAIFAAQGLQWFQKKQLQTILIAAIMIEGIANQYHDFVCRPNKKYTLELENICNAYTKEKELIAINGNLNPTSLYLAHRKGWSFESQRINEEHFLKMLKNNKCTLLIWDKHNGHKPENIPFFKEVIELDNYAIFQPI